MPPGVGLGGRRRSTPSFPPSNAEHIDRKSMSWSAARLWHVTRSLEASAFDDQVRLRIRDGLEAGISGATAQNVWSVLRTTFKETVSSRDRSLRLRSVDPTQGHKAPLQTPARNKTFLYPNEFATLVSCERVPRAWRETYAVAAYSYLRPEELQALTWRDVDAEAGTICVSKAMSGRNGKPKPLPKTDHAVRDVPIHPELAPLLARMRDNAGDEDAPVLPLLRKVNDKFRAKALREHLAVAGLTRPRLTADTATLLPVIFRSMRDSGITWLCLAGVRLEAAQRRAGHAGIAQTLGYVKMAEDLGGKVGTPFPPLPPDLLESPRIVPGRLRERKLAGKLAALGAGGGNRTPSVGESENTSETRTCPSNL